MGVRPEHSFIHSQTFIPMNPPVSLLQHYVSGAIERGEKEAIAEQPVRLLSTIPFQGFYYSCHEAAISSSQDCLLEDSNGDINTELAHRFYRHPSIHMSKVYTSYAEDYVKAFAYHGELDLIFDELTLPRKYHFETDRIFVTIPLYQAEALLAKADKEALEKAIHDKFTSRSGFISFYSNRLEDWPLSVSNWDHNQLGALIEVCIQDFSEERYAEDLRGNGYLDNMLDAALTEYWQRLVNIAYYLRQRQDRQLS